MSRVLILGATGALGRHVLRRSVGAGHDVTVFVRTRSKLPPEDCERVSVHTGDLGTLVPLDLIREQDALINCAGHVADGDLFVGLVDRLVTGVDSLPVQSSRSVGSWQELRCSISVRRGDAESTCQR